MEIICQIHPVEFQLYHDTGQMIQLSLLQRPKASDVRSIIREELTEKTYIYINQKLIFFIFQQIFSHIVFILLYTNDYLHPHPHPHPPHPQTILFYSMLLPRRFNPSVDRTDSNLIGNPIGF